jgi:metal-responsive CopG/Arc/MetJ family transcriptional regulator
MKEKTSITLSRDILAKIDRIAGSRQSRSAFIEAVLHRYLKLRARAASHARDLALLNAAADRLNSEALNALETQSLE